MPRRAALNNFQPEPARVPERRVKIDCHYCNGTDLESDGKRCRALVYADEQVARLKKVVSDEKP